MREQAGNDAFTALNALLQEERASILSGQFENLTLLIRKKADILAHLSELQPKPGVELETLKRSLHRNQMLLSSAVTGARKASGRLKALARQDRGLKTYSRDGTSQILDAATDIRLERRT